MTAHAPRTAVTQPINPVSADDPDRAPIAMKVANFIGVVVPFLGLIAAIILLWGIAFNWTYLILLVVMYVITAFGITIGYHRFFTHRSFKTSKPVAALLAIMGSMAVEGPVLEWVAVHRKHHQHSDDEHDPHSPHSHGSGIKGVFLGFIHAHVGWMFSLKPQHLKKYTHDLQKDKLIRRMSSLFPLWAAIGLIVPALIGGLVTMTWTGALLGFLWGGLVRVFLVHHVTWSINSVCHIWGTRPFKSHDHSRNNPIFGVLGMGEGWHNNHHAFPTSARHGLRWWEFDASWIVIWAMSKVGLVYDVRVPTGERLEQKRR
ncbi:MAG: fatty acid desaturase [Planctomycetota bacterium]